MQSKASYRHLLVIMRFCRIHTITSLINLCWSVVKLHESLFPQLCPHTIIINHFEFSDISCQHKQGKSTWISHNSILILATIKCWGSQLYHPVYRKWMNIIQMLACKTKFFAYNFVHHHVVVSQQRRPPAFLSLLPLACMHTHRLRSAVHHEYPVDKH